MIEWGNHVGGRGTPMLVSDPILCSPQKMRYYTAVAETTIIKFDQKETD